MRNASYQQIQWGFFLTGTSVQSTCPINCPILPICSLSRKGVGTSTGSDSAPLPFWRSTTPNHVPPCNPDGPGAEMRKPGLPKKKQNPKTKEQTDRWTDVQHPTFTPPACSPSHQRSKRCPNKAQQPWLGRLWSCQQPNSLSLDLPRHS